MKIRKKAYGVKAGLNKILFPDYKNLWDFHDGILI
jgi:hypothetical protein